MGSQFGSGGGGGLFGLAQNMPIPSGGDNPLSAAPSMASGVIPPPPSVTGNLTAAPSMASGVQGIPAWKKDLNMASQIANSSGMQNLSKAFDSKPGNAGTVNFAMPGMTPIAAPTDQTGMMMQQGRSPFYGG